MFMNIISFFVILFYLVTAPLLEASNFSQKDSTDPLILKNDFSIGAHPYYEKKGKKSPPSRKLNRTILPETSETLAIVDLLKTYQPFLKNKPISLVRLGRNYDGGYAIPHLAMERADVLLGYGISNDISFEDSAAEIYGVQSFGFDGTCAQINPQSDRCVFIPYNIESKVSSAYSQFPSLTFEEQLKMFNLQNKKMFIKMDIEGGEYNSLHEILDHQKNITGIVLEIHFCADDELSKALRLMQAINKNFLLVHVHGNNYCTDFFKTSMSQGLITRVLELTYINRNLVDYCQLSPSQRHPLPIDQRNNPHIRDVVFSINH